ncbi:tegument protein UL14 [Saimiriine betaherpesvirus 4]|uniref:Tegument protein UL14 n=1 Tax=Saimiriine betaherpesvirus 4 TaxID=1535247 RepID=G8XT00_9BETA|nr:tegument protein UL14 [Saimiriine betaherpesvirus 4]AEV80946.1 tegument protein UL14 [Saimiriine betaherpesvirus 4]
MTSTNKELLKEAMRTQLEKTHHQFLKRAYGEKHHLTHHQVLRVMRAALQQEQRRDALAVQEISACLLRDQPRVQQELGKAKELQRLQVDERLDSLTELKDTVEDSYSALVDSVSTVCEIDLEEERC